MALDDHILGQFTSVNRNLTSINKAIQELTGQVGRVEGVQLSQWGAIKRLERNLESVTETTSEDLYGLREVTGQLKTNVGLLEQKKMSKFPPVTPPIHLVNETFPSMKDVFTPGNVRLILLILLLLASILALAVGVTVPLKFFGG